MHVTIPEIQQNARDRRFLRALTRMLHKKDMEKVEIKFKEVIMMLTALESRYTVVMAHVHCFCKALDNGRYHVDPNDRNPIKTLSQVSFFARYVKDNQNDMRICRLFNELVEDLNDYRKILHTLSNREEKVNGKLAYYYNLWKKVLDPQQDISKLYSKVASPYIKKLSSQEARIFYRGVVSCLPIAMDCARHILKELRRSKPYHDHMMTFNTCEELRRLVEFSEAEKLRRDRIEHNKCLSKWRMPDRQAAKVRLNDAILSRKLRPDPNLLPERTRDIGTQRGNAENKPKRRWGFNRCQERFDQFGFPLAIKKKTFGPLTPSPPPPPPCVRTNKYSPGEIMQGLNAPASPKPKPREPRRKFMLEPRPGQLRTAASQTWGEWKPKPENVPYQAIRLEEIDPILDDFVGRADPPLWRPPTGISIAEPGFPRPNTRASRMKSHVN